MKRVVTGHNEQGKSVFVEVGEPDHVVEAPAMLQTTATPYHPAISGAQVRPLDRFNTPELGVQTVIARRVAQESKQD